MKNKKYKGLTLVETIVAISIFALSMEGVVYLFTRSWQFNSYTLEMGQSAMAVSRGVNTMVNHIRGARQADNGEFPIKSGEDNDLIIYSDYDKDAENKTERLHFYLSGNNLLMGVTVPSDTMPRTYPAEDEETITLASNIVNVGNKPVFQYFDKDFAGDETSHPPLSTPVSVADVRLIKVLLHINIDPNRAPDNIEMRSFVELRNLNDYDRIR